MPLGNPAGHASPDSFLSQVVRVTNLTSNESVYQSILESSQKVRGKTVLGQQ